MQNAPAKDKTVRVTMRMPESLRNNATTVANDLGLDLNAAINTFLTQMVKTNSIPFKLTNVHLSELDLALAEARTGKYNHYDSLQDLFDHIDAIEPDNNGNNAND